jgi:hypothetical protein
MEKKVSHGLKPMLRRPYLFGCPVHAEKIAGVKESVKGS